jgi:hypothetical protein
MTNLALSQLNVMFKNVNKTIYEVDGNINDLYYGKPINSNSSGSGGNFMSHSFGYGQPVQRGAAQSKNK